VPRERTPMRKIREILRLKWSAQLSNRAIAKSCAIARSTVAECLERAAEVGHAKLGSDQAIRDMPNWGRTKLFDYNYLRFVPKEAVFYV